MRRIRFGYNGSCEEWFFTLLFNDDIWKELKKWMYPNKKSSNFDNYRNGDAAITHQYFPLINNNKQLVFTEDGMIIACERGYLNIVKLLHGKKIRCSSNAINVAAKNGHLKVIKYLHQIGRLVYEASNGFGPIYYAADEGHVDVVKYLYRNKLTHGEEMAIRTAADQGYLKIIKILVKDEKYAELALNLAAKYGHLQVVRYIHENIVVAPTDYAITSAATNNHMDVVKFLLCNRFDGSYEEEMMDEIASEGHVEMLEFFYKETKERCTEEGMIYAVRKGHLRVIKFLHDNGNYPCIPMLEHTEDEVVIDFLSSLAEERIVQLLLSLG